MIMNIEEIKKITIDNLGDIAPYTTASAFGIGEVYIVQQEDWHGFGMGIYYRSTGIFYMAFRYIYPEYRNQGKGQKIIDELFKLADELGAKTISVEIRDDAKIKYFFEKEGFVVKENMIVMEKYLNK